MDFSLSNVLFLLSKFTLTTKTFGNLTFRNYQIVLLHLLIFVIRESHDAREYPNIDAMGVPLLSKGFHNAEHKCRWRLRHKNIIGRRGAAFARISVAWLGRIYPFSAESSYSGGKCRGSDVSTPIGPTNASKSLQKDITSRLLILNSLEQKNDHFHPNFIIHRFIPINLLK